MVWIVHWRITCWSHHQRLTQCSSSSISSRVCPSSTRLQKREQLHKFFEGYGLMRIICKWSFAYKYWEKSLPSFYHFFSFILTSFDNWNHFLIHFFSCSAFGTMASIQCRLVPFAVGDLEISKFSGKSDITFSNKGKIKNKEQNQDCFNEEKKKKPQTNKWKH